MSNPFVILQNPELPCDTCHADCCEAAPASREEFERIEKFFLGSEEKYRLAMRLKKQYRPFLKCPFVDMKTHKCAVYEVRPLVCKQFGTVEGMPCPHAPHPKPIPRVVSMFPIIQSMERSDGKYCVLGMDVTWSTIELEVVR